MEKSIENLIKEVGYGVAIHFNELRGEFEVYKIGTYHPGNGDTTNSVVTKNKSLKVALNKFIKNVS